MNLQKFSEAMGEINDRYIEEALRYKKKPGKGRLAKWGVIAACLALFIVAGLLFAPLHGDMAVSVYAHGMDEEITAAGAVISTGTISDSGKMHGKPLMFYLSGKDIATVRFSCRNQQLCFVDWTEKREEYGNAQNFTVVYGEDESEYYYLTIDWIPNTVIRELTDNPSSTIGTLPEEMRGDIIVLEITFADGRTATKALEVSLLDDGTFFASFDDYEISPADTFVKRPDSPAIPRDILYAQGSEATGSAADAAPMVYVNGRLYRQSLREISYEDKKEEFLYLGKIESDITARQNAAGSSEQGEADGTGQSTADGVPKENFQANHPIVGAEVCQYGEDIVIFINGKYWLYEAMDGEENSNTQSGAQNGIENGVQNNPQNEMQNDSQNGVQNDSQNGTEPDRHQEFSEQDKLSEEEKMQLDPSYTGLYAENSLAAAEEAARAYYVGTVFEVVSMELESQIEDEAVFSVLVKKGGVVQEPERQIFLQLNQGVWEVVNEGY